MEPTLNQSVQNKTAPARQQFEELTPEGATFNIDRHLLKFIQVSPFFSEISRHIFKRRTTTVPTAGIGWDPVYEQLTLFYNPNWLAKFAEEEVLGVIQHEYYHFVFGHITARRRTPHKMWNIATDLAINSLIEKDIESGTQRRLPSCVLMPGKWPVVDGKELTPEQKAALPVSALIAEFPELQSSEWYFEKLHELAKELIKNMELCDCSCHRGHDNAGNAGSGDGEGGDAEQNDEGTGNEDDKKDEGHGHGDSDGQMCPDCKSKGCGELNDEFGMFDDHGLWDSLSDEQRSYVEGKIKTTIEKAVRHADSMSRGWGNIPAEIREGIRQYVSNVINWRAVLRQFVGHIVRGNKTSSIKRINRRYPYIHPGRRHGWVAKLLIAMDQSGSVYNEMLVEFFGELASLSKRVSISVVPFDCTCNAEDVFEWKKGAKVEPTRTRDGGTNFDAPTNMFNDPANRGRWDGLLIMTDGQAPQPGPTRSKRGWVLGKGCDLVFPSDELKIRLDNCRKTEGAWR